MKDVYAVPDRHIRYAATKAFFLTKMTEGSSVQSHGVTMLSLVEKLEDLKAGFDNDTYIDVILQSLPPSYDPFIVNYNMNGLEKSIHELINMLVQYEATTHKSEPSVLVREASTSKAKGKGARRWKRKKGKGTAVIATTSTGGAPVAPKGKGKGKVLQRSRKLSKDEMVLRLGDGKVVAAEVVGSLSLVDQKVGRHKKSRNRRFGPPTNLRVLSEGKMTKKPFVGQSAIAKGLLDLVHTDVCGPLNIPARGGFSYFITFTDDQSWYGYVYLMSGLSWNATTYEVAERWNRTLLDMVRSMMSFKELPPSFWGHALEMAVKLLNISPSKSIPQTSYEIWHGKLASYKYLRVWGSPAYVKRLVGDKLDSRPSLCRFVGYPKENAGYYFYDRTEQKVFISRNAVFLEKSFCIG
ncbi:UNVERIFIED_CONTAM: hypothetical protein Sradi_7212900 [Sesamum radiatum]|uniref:Retroviral polymerase SH3-like domain-containing protein n=1 Tax=Sesamum radiatum TaxID=300843 RepID=A0AAW2IPC6_SESRA